MKQEIKFKIGSIVVGIFIAILFLEGIFSFLPVNEGLHLLSVTEKNPIRSMEKNRDFIWSQGWDFSIVTKKHANNFGFLNDQDYKRKEETPLMAIIGDSFVEADQVENKSAMYGILQNEIGDLGRIYSFGSNGSALPTYLAYAKYTDTEFKPNALVFVIVSNDFDESLIKYKKLGGYYYFEETSADNWEMVRVDFTTSLIRKVARKLATIRYIILNVGLKQPKLESLFKRSEGANKNSYVGNVLKKVEEERIFCSKKAIEIFFEKLPIYSNVPKENILFLVDGIRPHLYDPSRLKHAEGSYFDLMRKNFINMGKENDYEVIDLQPIFLQDFQKNGLRFEFENDFHWNNYGHQIVAREIKSSKVFKNTFLR